MEAGTNGDSINPWSVALFRTLELANPTRATEEAAYGKWLDQTSDREEARQDRLHGAEGIVPASIWIALALIAVLEPDELRRALASGDYATLTRAPGIGRKGAERLVLELRDKVGVATGGVATGPMAAAAWRPKLSDALVGLGFTVKQADDAIAVLASDTEDPAVADGDVGVLLRRALGLLGRQR